MKLFKKVAGVLLVAMFCLIAVPGISAESVGRFPATISSLSSLSIFVVLALLCLVVGLGLRAFSKPPTDLSINQTKK